MADDLPAVVIDNGSGMVKAGFANQDAPKCVFSSIVGRPKGNFLPGLGTSAKTMFVGDEAQKKKAICYLRYPIENGRIEHWDDMEAVWEHTFNNELRVNPEEQKCLLTEAPLNPIENREKMAEIMFEKFNVPNLYVAVQAVLSLYASGRTTGLVYDSGDGATHIVPVYEGLPIPGGVTRMDMAGRELTQHMQKCLQTMSGEIFTTAAEKECVRLIKEKTAYVAYDFEKEKAEFEADPFRKQYKYTLPDGRVIKVGAERFHTPECLFNPRMLNKELPGIHEAIHRSIQNCELDSRMELMRNIIVSGGSTMYDGLVERMTKELRELAGPAARDEINVEAPDDRKFSVWRGGAVLANKLTFNDWVSKEQYEEEGPSAVRRMSGGVSSYC